MAIDESELFEAVELEMSSAFRRRLERDLRAAASLTLEHESGPPVTPARVMADPTTRRQTWVTASAAALVIAVTVGITAIRFHEKPSLGRSPSPRTVLTSTATSPTTSPPAPGTKSGVPTTTATSPIAATGWTAVDLGTDSVVAAAFQQVTGDGPLFAWTSDLRASPEVASELYRSTDGTSWTQVPIPSGFSIVAATATSTHVTLLGFVLPGDAIAAAEVVAMLSDDAGSTWRTVPFDVTLPQRKAPGATLVRPATALIATHGTTVVASFSTADMWDSAPDVTFDSAGRVLPVERPLYVSVDDQPFQTVVAGDLPAGPGPTVALSVSNGQFLALATPPSAGNSEPAVLWQSDDGHTWTSLGSLPTAVPGATIGKIGDRYVVVPLCCAQSAWISADGAQWRSANFGDLPVNAQPDSLHSALAVIDPNGITVAGMYLATNSKDVDYAKDGVIERLVGGKLSDLVFLDQGTGTELGRVTTTPFDNGSVRALGDGKIDILDAEGNVRTSFTPDELTGAINAAASNPPPPVGVILHSDDGDTWTSASINAIAGGSPTGVSWIQRTGTLTTVGAFVSTESETAPTHLVVMVGHEHT